MKTVKQFVIDAQGMFMTAGWREIFLPEVKLLRDSLVEDLIYGDKSPEALASDRSAVRALDQLIGFEQRIADMAAGLAENPKDGEDVVQSATSAAQP